MRPYVGTDRDADVSGAGRPFRPGSARGSRTVRSARSARGVRIARRSVTRIGVRKGSENPVRWVAVLVVAGLVWVGWSGSLSAMIAAMAWGVEVVMVARPVTWCMSLL